MPRIVNNRICYQTHNILLNANLYTNNSIFATELLLELADYLPEEGTAAAHNRELATFRNGLPRQFLSVERPTIQLTPMPDNDFEEKGYAPCGSILATVLLHNGNYLKVRHIVSVPKADGFRPIWMNLYQRGFRVGALQRHLAEDAFGVVYMKHVCHCAKNCADNNLEAMPMIAG